MFQAVTEPWMMGLIQSDALYSHATLRSDEWEAMLDIFVKTKDL